MKWRHILTDQVIFLLIASIIFFFIYSSFVFDFWLPQNNLYGQIIYSWPDAMANQAFVNQFIKRSNFIIEVPGNYNLNNVIHPRSVNVINGNLVPMGFLGLPMLYGFAGKFLGINGVLFLTPLITVLTSFFFYGLIKRIFNRTIGIFSALLFLTLAPVWYYAMQVMLSTLLFLFLIISGLWFLTYNKDKKLFNKISVQYIFIAIGAILIGLSLTVRLNEAPWVLFSCLLIFIVFGLKKWYWKLSIFLIFFLIALFPMLYENQVIYGNYWSVGYLNFQINGNYLNRLPTEFSINSSNEFLNWLRVIFLPFGFHPRLLWHNFFRYFIKLFWPYFIVAVAGIFWYIIHKKKSKKTLIYWVGFAGVATWLILYYGNWQFLDPLVLKYNTIGSSYVRYWVPLYVFMLPAIGYLIFKIFHLKISKVITWTICILIIVSLSVYSYLLTYNSPKDGIKDQRHYLTQYQERFIRVKNIVPSNSLLIVDRMDKIFFPKYQVSIFFDNYDIFTQLKKIILYQPIYFFTDRDDDMIDKINSHIDFIDLKLQLTQIIDSEYRLFKLETK